jgi:catechol 2,3-dioxygenase-like lactoylglutathione lyase family enzyme
MESYFILYVADQQRSRDFYAAALGIEPRLDVQGMTEFALRGGGTLGLMPEAGIKRLLGNAIRDPASACGIARAELYLLGEDAFSDYIRAVRAGATEISPPEPRSWGHLAGYCLDPDGHVLAVASPM